MPVKRLDIRYQPPKGSEVDLGFILDDGVNCHFHFPREIGSLAKATEILSGMDQKGKVRVTQTYVAEDFKRSFLLRGVNAHVTPSAYVEIEDK